MVEPESGYTIFYKGQPASLCKESSVGVAVKTHLVANLKDLPYGFSDCTMTRVAVEIKTIHDHCQLYV